MHKTIIPARPVQPPGMVQDETQHTDDADDSPADAPATKASQTLLHALATGLHSVEKASHQITENARHVGEQTKRAADEAIRVLLDRLRRPVDELRSKAEAARERGIDFLDKHRDEITALLITAGKIALVIGIRRLTASQDQDPDAPAGKRLRDTSRIFLTLADEVGKLIAASPSALPLLRERYHQGEAGEQALIGMLLGPSLVGEPEHAVAVIGEFLADAKDSDAADAIGRRTLAPVLRENPEALRDVRSLLEATGPLVRRGALVALTRYLEDRRSRLGDVLAAAVIVLEDHDHEARQAMRWLLETAAGIDPEATAKAIASRIRAQRKAAAPKADEALEQLPAPLRAQVEAVLEADEDPGLDRDAAP